MLPKPEQKVMNANNKPIIFRKKPSILKLYIGYMQLYESIVIPKLEVLGCCSKKEYAKNPNQQKITKNTIAI